MKPFDSEFGTNPSHFLYDCVWEEILNFTGQIGRNKTEFLEVFYIELCSVLDAGLCLEIGAHEARGMHKLRNRLPEARLIAFEANPYVFEHYAARVDKSISYLNKIISHDDKPKTLLIPRVMPTPGGQRELPRGNLTSSIRPRNVDKVEYEEVTVASTSIDEIIAENKDRTPAVAWIDVEGAAGEVLFGAKDTLKQDIAVLYIELEKNQTWKGQWTDEDIHRYLSAYRFIPLARDKQTPWQYNQIYIKQNLLGNPKVVAVFRRFLAALLKGEWDSR
jgi:FkbM family methyltransferase